MKQKKIKITESTLVQYQQNKLHRNGTTPITDPTSSMTLTTTVTGINFYSRPRR